MRSHETRSSCIVAFYGLFVTQPLHERVWRKVYSKRRGVSRTTAKLSCPLTPPEPVVPKPRRSRREFLRISLSFVACAESLVQAPRPAEAFSNIFAAPEDLPTRLEQRVSQEIPERIFQSNLYFPDYFTGTWDTESTLLSATCPAGYKLFGRPGSFEEATKQVGKVLKYESRFIQFDGHVVCDRPFNVTAISRSTMGPYSVLDCDLVGDSPNYLKMSIRPSGGNGSIFFVGIKTIARQQQTSELPPNLGNEFDGGSFEQREYLKGDLDNCTMGLFTSETVRQEIQLDTENLRIQPLIKHVETTTVFLDQPGNFDTITAWQKTSIYLTRSSLKYVDARGKPIDVRWYRVRYSRV